MLSPALTTVLQCSVVPPVIKQCPQQWFYATAGYRYYVQVEATIFEIPHLYIQSAT